MLQHPSSPGSPTKSGRPAVSAARAAAAKLGGLAEGAGDVRRDVQPAPVRPQQVALDPRDLRGEVVGVADLEAPHHLAEVAPLGGAAGADGENETLRSRRTSHRCQPASSSQSPRAESW